MDIHVLNYDGNLIDASALGAMVALSDATVPASKYDKGDDFKLEINNQIITCSFAKVGKTILLDPSLDEETVAKGRISVALDENHDIRAAQKGLCGSFTLDEIKQILSTSKKANEKLRKIAKEVLDG